MKQIENSLVEESGQKKKLKFSSECLLFTGFIFVPLVEEQKISPDDSTVICFK